jgi:hypothetical protein
MSSSKKSKNARSEKSVNEESDEDEYQDIVYDYD